MAGNPKTPKSTAPSKASGASTKGVKVGMNPKAGVSSTASVGKKKK